MIEGLHSAAAGMAAQQQRIDAVSSDLANVNTNGYKQARVAFRDLVYSDPGRPAAPGVRTGAGSAAVIAGRSVSQGPLKVTGQPLDVAIQGEGYLQVRLPDGRAALTRDGALQLDGTRRLVNATGGRIEPAVTIPAGVSLEDVKIRPDGTVLADGRQIGRLGLVTVRSPQSLAPAGDTALVPTPASGAPTAAPARSVLTQGSLEGSNVEVSEAMVNVIEAQRAYQLASRAISTADQMMEIANGVKR